MNYRVVLRSNLLVLITSNTANAANYVASVLMGRYMSPEDFGIYNAVCSLGLILSAFTGVFPYFASKYIVELNAAPERQVAFIRKCLWLSAFVGAITGILISVLAPVFTDYLAIDSVLPFICYALTISITFPFMVLYGVQLGYLKSVAASVQMLGHSLVKVLFIVIFIVLLGHTYNAAILAIAIANIVIGVWFVGSLMTNIRNIQKPDRNTMGAAEFLYLTRFLGPLGLNLLVMSALSNIDIVLVKHFFSAETAGIYSGASILARIAYFLPIMMNAVLFPEVVRSRWEGESPKSLIILTVAMSVAINGVYVAAVYFGGQYFIEWTFGERYLGAVEYLPTLVAAMSMVAILSTFFTAFLGYHYYRYLGYVSCGLVATIGFICFTVNRSPLEIVRGLLGGTLLMAVICLLLLWRLPISSKQVAT